MLRKTLLSLLVLLPACNYSVDNAVRTIGGDVFCSSAATGVAVCYSRSRQKAFVCFSNGGESLGQAVCLEGLPPLPEAGK